MIPDHIDEMDSGGPFVQDGHGKMLEQNCLQLYVQVHVRNSVAHRLW